MTLAPLLQASLAIQIHTLAAVLAFVLGACVLFRRKGDTTHRLAGRFWVALMLVVCISSMFIHTSRLIGIWSPIHLLSISTTWFLFVGVAAARRGRIQAHRTTMKKIYLGALIVAGLFTFVPGRIMHEVFFGGPDIRIGIALAILLVMIVGSLIGRLVYEKYVSDPRKKA